MIPAKAKVKHEAQALVQILYGFVIVVLVMVGIGGTIYKVMAPDGWIAAAFGRSASAGAASLGSLLLIGALAWFSRGWSSPKGRHRASELLVYTCAAAGAVYLAQLWIKGML